MSSSFKPLFNVRVLELGGLAPVPLLGMMLADHGASVLRITASQPGIGIPGLLSRNKASLELDLKLDRDIEILFQLLERTDVLLDPFRPGVLERILGLTSIEDLLRRFPRLIVARLSGYGQTPSAHPMYAKAGHDLNYLAMSGILSQLGADRNQPPQAPLNLLADFAGGSLMSFSGILMALYAREMWTLENHKGVIVDCSMMHGVQYLAAFVVELCQRGLWDPTKRGGNLLDGGAPFYQCYRTRDGETMAVACLEPEFYQRFIQVLERVDPSMSEFATCQMDTTKWKQMQVRFKRVFQVRTRHEWQDMFAQVDACVTPVLGLKEALGDQLTVPKAQPRMMLGSGQDTSKNPRFKTPEQILSEFGVSRKSKL